MLDKVQKQDEGSLEKDREEWSSIGPFSARRSNKSPRSGSVGSSEDIDERGIFDINFYDILKENDPIFRKEKLNSLAEIKYKMYNKFNKPPKRNNPLSTGQGDF